MKKVLRLLLVLVLMLTVAGCKKGDDSNKTSYATGIAISTRSSRVQIEHSIKFTYKLTPANGVAEGITWSINDTTLGSISEDGTFTAGTKEGIVKVTVSATAGDKTITATKAIQVTLDPVVEYPDLGGYTIKIAQATVALGEIDPFMEADTAAQYGYYDGEDREARQKAWTSVEDDFNCTIAVVEYPSDAAWGPSRWSYIETQARLDSPEYDFYVVPDAQIPGFVSAGAINDLTEWYESYGNSCMNSMSKTAGSYKNHLYSINTADAAIYNMLGYNVPLYEKLLTVDPELKEPATLYLEGTWDYSTFVSYCEQVQNDLNSLYGAESGYYAVSGWPTYYWVGMVDRSGDGIADLTNLKMNLTTDVCTAAGDALKEIYAYGAFDPSFSVDGGVQSWNQGKALFNTGDWWFINSNQTRWTADLWGEGDSTRYGYVPFAAPDGYDPEHTYIGLTSEACWVMAAGRDNAHRGYGDECTDENVYYAIITYWQRARQYYEEEEDYDPNKQIIAEAAAKLGSTAAQQAYIKASQALEQDGFYDPLTSNSNSIVATYASDIDQSIRAYVKGTGESTWAEAIGIYQEELDKAIASAFG